MPLPSPVPAEDLTTQITGEDYNLLVEAFNTFLAYLQDRDAAYNTALTELQNTTVYVSRYADSAYPVPANWEDRSLLFIGPSGVYPPSQYAVNGNEFRMELSA